jgi:NADH dehydrogenase
VRILVTGATGFIGRRFVARAADRGDEIAALVRRDAPGLDHPRIARFAGSLSDEATLRRAAERCDAVVHLAVASGTSDPRIVHAVNVDGTARLLEAARSAGVRRFVFVSTISATRARRGPYGETKRIGEEMVARSGMPFVIVRPSLVYGPGGLGLFASLTAYLRSLPVVPVVGNGEIELDPIHVDDVCAVIERALVAPEVLGRTYDLLGPERVTFNQFLAMLSRELGIAKPAVHIPGPIALLMARVLGLISKRPPITLDNAIGMIYPAKVDRTAVARDFDVPWTRLSEGLSGLMKEVLAGGVAASAPAPPDSRPVRAGIVGLGKMGVVHASVLSMMPGVTLAGICDIQPALARSLRGMGHTAPFFPELDRMIAEARLDAVWICTPPDSHARLARRCAEAGIAVMVEKPLAHSLESARELRDAAARAPIACGYAQAFMPVFAAAEHAVRSGALGPIRSVRSSMNLSQVFGPQKGWIADPARSGGGVVANLSSHLLFLLGWTFGVPVLARATSRCIHGAVEDELDGTFTLADGAEVSFHSSWSVPGYPISFTTIDAEGENGTLSATNETLVLELRAPAGGWRAGATRILQGELPQTARFDLNGEFYDHENARFLEWVTGGDAPPNTAAAAWDAQCMMEALYRSAAREGERVEVPR